MTLEDATRLTILPFFSAMVAGVIVATVWRYIKKKRKAKPVPVAWDGVHKLRGIKHVEHFGSRPEDFTTGWIWECTCGVGNKHNYLSLPYHELGAVKEYREHKDLYKDMEHSFGS